VGNYERARRLPRVAGIGETIVSEPSPTKNRRGDWRAVPELYDSDARTGLAEDFARVWAQRRLIGLIARRQLMLRYQRSLLGVWWTLLAPSLQTAVLWIVFSHVFRRSTGQAPYSVYLLAGMVIVTIMQLSILGVTGSARANAMVLTRVRIPSEVFAIAAGIDTFVSSAVLVIPLAVVMAVTGTGFDPTLPLIVVPLALFGLLTLGVGMILAPIAARFQDVTVALTSLLLLAQYLTPVIYPITILPHRLQTAEHFNPIYQFVTVFRDMLYENSVGSWHAYAAMLLSAVIALTVGVIVTRRTRTFVLEAL
jgi:ABC-type polysaccharide/polyol phosphate export permease